MQSTVIWKGSQTEKQKVAENFDLRADGVGGLYHKDRKSGEK